MPKVNDFFQASQPECTCSKLTIKLQAAAQQLYLKETPAHVFSCEFYKSFRNTEFAERL